jgi:hypothetical protein
MQRTWKKFTKSTTRLFANDCFLCWKIKSECTLQRDLDTIQKWQSQYLMRFNPEKWEVLQITTRRTTLQYKYTIQGQVLNHFNSAKNLWLGLNIHKTFHRDNEMTKIRSSNQSHTSYRKYKSENGRIRTSEYIRRGIRCHGGVSIHFWPVTPAHQSTDAENTHLLLL